MSDFDRKVLEWLNQADLPKKSKATVLNRTSAGIESYRRLFETDAKLFDRITVAPALDAVVSRAHRRLGDGIDPIAVLPPPPVPTLALKKADTVRRESSAIRSVSQQRRSPSAGTARSASRASSRPPGKATERMALVSKAGTKPPLSSRGHRTPSSSIPAAASSARRHQDPAAHQAPAQPAAAPSPKEEPPLDEAAPFAEDLTAFTFGETDAFGAAPFDPKPQDEDEDEEAEEMSAAEDAYRRKSITQKRMSRQAVSAEVLRPEDVDAAEFEETPKDDAAAEAAFATLERHVYFAHFEDETLQQFVRIAQHRALAANEPLVTMNEPLDEFAMVVAGSVRTLDGSMEALNPVSGGPALECIADNALLYETPSTATIVAGAGGAEVLVVSRSMYKVLSERSSKEKRARYEGFLSNVKFLSGLERHERLQLADALKTAKYGQGEALIKYGEEGAWFSLIVEGTVEVIGRDEAGQPLEVCTFTAGDCVGELEFLFEHNTVADVVARTPTVKTAKMTKRHFEKVIGPARAVLERQAENDDVFAYYRKARESAGV